MNRLKIKSLSPTPLVLILAIATLIAVPLRTYQLISCIEPATGFWLKQSITEPILYTLLALVALVALFISFFSGIMPEPKLSNKRNIPLGIVSMLFVFFFVLDAVGQMSRYMDLITAYDSAQYASFFTYMVSSGTLALTLQSLFGVLSAFYFAIVAFSFCLEKESYKKRKILALAPVLWGISRMIYYFSNPISYKNVSQLILELGTLTFFLIFFFSFARIASGVNHEKSEWILWFSGIAGAFFGFISSLSPLTLLVTGKAEFISQKYPLQAIDLLFAIFATIILFASMPRTVKNNSETEIGE